MFGLLQESAAVFLDKLTGDSWFLVINEFCDGKSRLGSMWNSCTNYSLQAHERKSRAISGTG